MFDLHLRPVKERALAPLARALGDGVSPMAVTLLAFVAGIGASVFAARAMMGGALACWIVNRFLDGLDGTLARTRHRQSDLGGYVDVLLDYVVYAAIPIGLVLRAPSAEGSSLGIAALVMVSSFYVNAASWMHLSALLERRGAGAQARGELTSVTMPGGLIGGTETIVFYTLFLLLPAHLVGLFAIMTVLVIVTIVQRLAWSVRGLADSLE